MSDIPVSLKAFADMLGCKPSYVTQLKKDGRLILTADGRRVYPAASVAKIEETRDPSKAGVAQRHAASQAARAAALMAAPEARDAASDDGENEAPDDSPEYQLWRARGERAKALRAEMLLQQEAGNLVELSMLSALVGDVISMLGQRLDNLAYPLGQTLSPESDPQRCTALLKSEFDSLRRALAEDFTRARRTALGGVKNGGA
jgi:hypothetical protein